MRTLLCIIGGLSYLLMEPIRLFRKGFVNAYCYYEFKTLAKEMAKQQTLF